MLEIKKNIHQTCLSIITNRLESIEIELQQMQSAANEESKSSKGDKYETSRAMVMLEKEKLLTAHQTAAQQLQLLKTIDLAIRTVADTGALVRGSGKYYYLSVALGQVESEDISAWVISAASPVGKVLTGKKKGDIAVFRNQQIHIEDVA